MCFHGNITNNPGIPGLRKLTLLWKMEHLQMIYLVNQRLSVAMLVYHRVCIALPKLSFLLLLQKRGTEWITTSSPNQTGLGKLQLISQNFITQSTKPNQSCIDYVPSSSLQNDSSTISYHIYHQASWVKPLGNRLRYPSFWFQLVISQVVLFFERFCPSRES